MESYNNKQQEERIGLEVLCRYRYIAKWQLIKKLEGLPPSNHIVILTKMAFLKVLTFTKDFIDNTEFNKCHSQLVAALK